MICEVCGSMDGHRFQTSGPAMADLCMTHFHDWQSHLLLKHRDTLIEFQTCFTRWRAASTGLPSSTGLNSDVEEIISGALNAEAELIQIWNAWLQDRRAQWKASNATAG